MILRLIIKGWRAWGQFSLPHANSILPCFQTKVFVYLEHLCNLLFLWIMSGPKSINQSLTEFVLVPIHSEILVWEVFSKECPWPYPHPSLHAEIQRGLYKSSSPTQGYSAADLLCGYSLQSIPGACFTPVKPAHTTYPQGSNYFCPSSAFIMMN